MASTSRCPRPGRSPWGPKPPHHRVRMSGWPTSEGLGVGYPGGATPGDSRVREVWPWEGEGHGGRAGGVTGRGLGLLVSTPSCLLSVS